MHSSTKKGLNVQVQCQRRYHAGYNFIRGLVRNTVQEFGVPMTHLEVYHCDGMWNMPEEFLSRENHPYKYGYGKLFHSGYHFVDLAAWLIEAGTQRRNDQLELYANCVRPHDFTGMINESSYGKLFGDTFDVSTIQEVEETEEKRFGEIDFCALAQLRSQGKVQTTCSINLLQNGFSRRAWTELPKDTYKGNGRVRHERLNLQVGPLLNIQVHSYQSHEVAERDSDPTRERKCGGLEHFDVLVFRNAALIGGKPFEQFSSGDFFECDGQSGFIGFNEQAREECLRKFLANDADGSHLDDHELGMRLLHASCKSLARRAMGENPIIQADL